MIWAFHRVIKEKYATFDGRASRSEYWWFALGSFLISLVIKFVFGIFDMGETAISIYSIFIFIPSIAVSVRRLHDIGKSGWYYLVFAVSLFLMAWFSFLMMLLAFLLFLYWVCKASEQGPNRFGEQPEETLS